MATHLLVVAIAALVAGAVCAATARALGGDPLLGAELGVGGVTVGWLGVLALSVRGAVHGQRELQRRTRLFRRGGRLFRLIDSSHRRDAFVLGPFRPEIFVSRPLLDALDDEELDAVLLHEEHHRRTGAPLRTMALQAWMQLVGSVPVLGRCIDRRLAQLEIDADRYAMAAGATAATIASALVKCDRADGRADSHYASAADLRLRQLTGGAVGGGVAAAPIEWLAPGLLGLGLAVCHLVLG